MNFTSFIFSSSLIVGILLLSLVVGCSGPDHRSNSVPVADEETREVVVLIHGLGRTKLSFTMMARALEREGFEVVTWGYSSTCCTVPEIGADLAESLSESVDDEHDKVHFVGHSTGNIVVRWLLEEEPPTRVGHVVMLAPPNGGSEMADRYAVGFPGRCRPSLT